MFASRTTQRFPSNLPLQTSISATLHLSLKPPTTPTLPSHSIPPTLQTISKLHFSTRPRNVAPHLTPNRPNLSPQSSSPYQTSIHRRSPVKLTRIHPTFRPSRPTRANKGNNNNFYDGARQGGYPSSSADPNFSLPPPTNARAKEKARKVEEMYNGGTKKFTDTYEQSMADPNPNVGTSRFLKWYGEQRNMYGHETDKNTDSGGEIIRKMMKKPEFLEKFDRDWGNNKFMRLFTRRAKAHRLAHEQETESRRWRRVKQTMVGLSMMSVLLQIGYDSDAGWQGIMLLGTLVFIIWVLFPLFVILTILMYFKIKWQERNRKREQRELLAKYTMDPDEITDEAINNMPAKQRLAFNEQKQKLLKSAESNSVIQEVIGFLGLKKKNSLGNDVLKYIDIDPENFDPKEFLVKKFPGFVWSETGFMSDEQRRKLAGKDQNAVTAEYYDFSGEDELVDPGTTKNPWNLFNVKTSSDFANWQTKLQGYPMMDGPELQRELLEVQKEEVRRIREGGPKDMLDYMIHRLQSEQDELALDRDVVSMNVERLMDLIKGNIGRYQSAVRRQKSGHIVERFEEVINDQRGDLLAFLGELESIDQRGWELTRRLNVLHQSLHNAVYSNLNGIDHPVVKDIIASDIQQVIFGHTPSDLLDQTSLDEFSSFLVPIQKKFIQGSISLEDARNIIDDQFQYFFPVGYQLNVKLPPISRLTGQNRSKNARLKVQHVLEPLVDEGPATQMLIDVAVEDYVEEMQNKFEEVEEATAFLTPERKAQLKQEYIEAKRKEKPWYQQIWDGDIMPTVSDDELNEKYEEEQDRLDRDLEAQREKFELRGLRYQNRRQELLRVRQEKQMQYEIANELNKYAPTPVSQSTSATKRTLGSYGKDNLSKFQDGNDKSASEMLFSVPLPPKTAESKLFLKDGSFVGGYARELQNKRDLYEATVAMEREKQAHIQMLQKKKEKIIETAEQDMRIVHQLETDRIAFGAPIVTEKDIVLQQYEKENNFLNKLWLAPKDSNSKDEKDRIRASISARPSFWSGSMFQHDIDMTKELEKSATPIPSTKLVIFKKILNVIGVEPSFLNNPISILPTSYDSKELERIKQNHLWKEMQKEELLAKKFFSTVDSTLSSDGSTSVSNQWAFDHEFDKVESFSRSTSPTATIVPASQMLSNSYKKYNPDNTPNWHLDVDIDQEIKSSFRSQSTITDLAKNVTKLILPATLLADEESNVTNRVVRSKDFKKSIPGTEHLPAGKQSAGVIDINREFSTTFPQLEEAITNTKYDPKLQKHENLLLNPLPDPNTKNDEGNSGWFSWFGKKKERYEDSNEFKQIVQEHQSNIRQDKWSLSFDDINRIESQSQYDLIAKMSRADDRHRERELDEAFEKGKADEVQPHVTRPELTIEDLKKQKISRGWGK